MRKLYYYTDETKRELKGEINLQQCERVITKLVHPKHKFVFSCSCPDREWYLAASTEEDMNEWAEVIISLFPERSASNAAEIVVARGGAKANSRPASIASAETNSVADEDEEEDPDDFAPPPPPPAMLQAPALPIITSSSIESMPVDSDDELFAMIDESNSTLSPYRATRSSLRAIKFPPPPPGPPPVIADDVGVDVAGAVPTPEPDSGATEDFTEPSTTDENIATSSTPITGEIHRVLYDFTSDNTVDGNQISVVANAEVQVIQSAGDWTWIQIQGGAEGYIPTSYISPDPIELNV